MAGLGVVVADQVDGGVGPVVLLVEPARLARFPEPDTSDMSLDLGTQGGESVGYTGSTGDGLRP